MNELSLTIPGSDRTETATSPIGQPIVLNYDIPNGEGEGLGVHLVATLTPTLTPGKTQWVLRVENNGDAVDRINVVAEVARNSISGGENYSSQLRGSSIRRMLFVGDKTFQNNNCIAPDGATSFMDKSQIAIEAGGATELGTTVLGP